jgi:hypothetical protein
LIEPISEAAKLVDNTCVAMSATGLVKTRPVAALQTSEKSRQIPASVHLVSNISPSLNGLRGVGSSGQSRRMAQSNVIRAAAAADKIGARPDATGRFGRFGGKYVPETLISALADLEKAYADAMADPEFIVRVWL